MPSPTLGLPELLLVVTRGVLDAVHERLAAAGHDVRPAHGYVFQLLAATGGASGTEVAQHLGVTKQAAALLLDGLERQGYLDRVPDPREHRARLAVLTERGWDCIHEAERLWRAAEAETAELIGVDGLAALHDGLARLALARGWLEPPLRLKPVW